MRLKRFYGRYFILGCIFLFNPTVQLFDILPDFIGYLLIATSLKEISVLEHRLENAMHQCYYLAGIGALRLGLMFLSFDMDSTGVLSCVSLLAAAEGFFLIYFFVSLFAGLTYLAQRCDSDSILGGIDSFRTVCLVFAAFHVLCPMLPELAALFDYTLEVDPSSLPSLTPQRLLNYKNYAIVLLFVLNLAVGIWWLRWASKFFKNVKSDTRFKTALEGRYGDYVGDVPLEEFYLTFKGVLYTFVAACVFLANFRLFDDPERLKVGEVASTTLVLPAWIGVILLAYVVYRLGGRGRVLIGYGLAAAAQIMLSYFVKGDYLGNVAVAAVGFASFFALYGAEERLAAKMLDTLDVDIKGKLLWQRILFGVHVGFTAAFAFTGIELLHTAKLICYIAWFVAVISTFVAISDYIKTVRNKH